MTVLYGLGSVPLALRYLSVEEFGLLMLLIQFAGYFVLVEIGMSGAAARILIDHKDTREDGQYGCVLLTSALVFCVQSCCILLLGIASASSVVSLLGVPDNLHEDGVFLLKWLTVCFAFATLLKVFSALLYANKRLDIINCITGFVMVTGLLLMGIVLATGGGLRGLVWMFLLQSVTTAILQGLACWKLRLWPPKGSWGKPTFSQFKTMFAFAKDVFVVNVGIQVLEASQLIIISRTMGLTAAAMWSVGTKVFNLLYQLLTRIGGTAIVFFSEMMIRGEQQHLKARFLQLSQISAGLAVVTLAVAVSINKPFVEIWAEPDLAWSLTMSSLMGIVVFLNLITRCYIDLILHTKQLLGLRYVYFLEAAIFIAVAVFLADRLGLYGVLFATLGCLLFVRLWYTALRVSKYLHASFWEVCVGWYWRSLTACALLCPFIITSPYIAGHFSYALAQLTGALLWTGIPSLAILVAVALPKGTLRELRDHILNNRLFSTKKRLS